MKNAKAVLFLFLVTAGIVYAQPAPIIGYGTMEWGTSIEEFKKFYPDAVDITTSAQNAIGEKTFQQENVGGGILIRFFDFFENKMYRVFVAYEDLDSNMIIAISEKLISLYGAFDYTDTSRSGGVSKTSYYRDYNDDLFIRLNIDEVFNAFNIKVRDDVFILYANPIVNGKVFELMQNRRKNDLQL